MASAMSVAAAGLSPGQFAVLKPSNAPRVNYPNTYADSATWDPINKKIYFVGQGDDTLVGYNFLIYDDANNAWSEGPALPGIPKGCTLFFHGYDLNTINPANGDFYRALHRPDRVGQRCGSGPWVDLYRYRPSTGTWTAIGNNTLQPDQSSFCCEAIAWFPELNGVIWFYPPNGRMYLYSETTGQWSLFATVSGCCTGNSPGIAEYDPVNHVILVGDAGGMFRVTSAGVSTSLGALQPTYYDGTGYSGTIAPDPVTGKMVYIKAHSTSPYTPPYFIWDHVNKTTTGPVSGLPAPSPTYGATTSTPISTYGVVGTIFCNTANDCGIILFKNSLSTPDTTPPAQPQNLVVTPRQK